MRLPSHKIIAAIGATLIIFGVAILLGWQVARWIGGPGLATTEFPLGDPHDVAVDSHGRIYVAENFYGRVQRYSPQGEFERGWSVPTAGAFTLRTTADDRLEVATARANQLLTYSSDGDLLSALKWQGVDRYDEFASERDTTGGYIVRRGLLPYVENVRTGEQIVVTPVLTRLVAAPFPAILYVATGFALFAAAEWRRRHAVPANPSMQRTATASSGAVE